MALAFSLHLCNNNLMKKRVIIDKRAEKEIKKFPIKVRKEIQILIELLEERGKLNEPYAKKIKDKLFEIRIRYRGQWRILYYYFINDLILALSAFKKTQQKTPLQEIKKAETRLKEYFK